MYACWSSHIEYRSRSRNQPVFEISTADYSTSLTWITNTALPTTTLCDGIPRVLGQPSTQLTITYLNEPMETLLPNTNTVRKPTCTIAEQACSTAFAVMDSLVRSFQAASVSAHSDAGTANAHYEFESLTPPCSMVEACHPSTVFPSQTRTYSCRLIAHSPTVVYWPVSISDHCDPNAVPKEATPTIKGQPNTAVFRGATITSPSALIVLHTIQGRYTNSRVYRSCGSILPSATFIMPTKDMSSMSWSFAPNMAETWDATQIPKPFSIADLHAVRFGPYANQKGCNTKLLNPDHTTPYNCPTMINADYAPTLAVPTHVADLSEQFKGCDIGAARNALYIPITGKKVVIPTSRTLGVTVTTLTVIVTTPAPISSEEAEEDDSETATDEAEPTPLKVV
jgi:hypothetical protein